MRFSIRDLLWATLVVAMGLGWWNEHKSAAHWRTESERVSAENAAMFKVIEDNWTPSR
jgi:hypothetical protein